MNNFINNIISRHVDSGKNVMPRLRSRFESPDNSAVDLPVTFAPVHEKFTEQVTDSTQAPSVNNKNITKEKNTSVEKDHSFLSSKIAPPQNNNDNDFQIPNRLPLTPVATPVVEQQNDQVVPETNNEKKILKEKYLVIDNYRKIISTEQVINMENDSVTDFSATVLPVKPKPVSPVIENKELNGSTNKSYGWLGEPPGAKVFNHLNADEKSLSNEPGTGYTPVIKVSIGQINVRAVTQTPVAIKKPRIVLKPALSLEDYLKQQGKGK